MNKKYLSVILFGALMLKCDPVRSLNAGHDRDVYVL